MPVILSPMQLIFIRLLGGMIIFWLFQRLFVFEKVERRDLVMLAVCGMFGFALNQALFYEGLNLSTPIDASLIHVLNPILVMVFASLIIGEKITWIKTGGIALGASGVMILILSGRSISFDGSHAIGNVLIFLNIVFYALYLVLIKPLIGKYHTTTILKWVSFFGFLFVLPFSLRPALQINFSTITPGAWLAIAYVVVLNTFVAYLLINFALKHVSAGVVSYYSYTQPVLASVMAVSVGQGSITLPKVFAAALIFTGVWLVNRKVNSKRSA
jgi:drug/metabolite transporter (DMT)-like permease